MCVVSIELASCTSLRVEVRMPQEGEERTKAPPRAAEGDSAPINLLHSLICVLLLIAALLTSRLKSHLDWAETALNSTAQN